MSKLVLILLVAVAMFSLAHAQTATDCTPATGQVCTELAGPVSNVGEYLAQVVKWSARLGVVAAVLVIVFAGNTMITSGGSPEGISSAKELIQGALIGLITIFLLGAILAWLVDTSQFSNNSSQETTNQSN